MQRKANSVCAHLFIYLVPSDNAVRITALGKSLWTRAAEERCWAAANAEVVKLDLNLELDAV